MIGDKRQTSMGRILRIILSKTGATAHRETARMTVGEAQRWSYDQRQLCVRTGTKTTRNEENHQLQLPYLICLTLSPRSAPAPTVHAFGQKGQGFRHPRRMRLEPIEPGMPPHGELVVTGLAVQVWDPFALPMPAIANQRMDRLIGDYVAGTLPVVTRKAFGDRALLGSSGVAHLTSRGKRLGLRWRVTGLGTVDNRRLFLA
jgi:hypothetical protein